MALRRVTVYHTRFVLLDYLQYIAVPGFDRGLAKLLARTERIGGRKKYAEFVRPM